MADLKGLAERLRGSVTASGGIDLRDPRLLFDAATIIERLDREALAGTIQDFMLARYSRFITEGSAADFADAILSHLQGGEDA